MKNTLWRFGASLAALTACWLGAPGAALAQDFPTRPVTIVVPFPAGGITDVVARGIADKMRVGLKQPVIVDNRPGAASLIALNHLRSKPADGYTLVMMSTTITTLPSLNANANYSIRKDFTSLAGIGRGTMVVVAHKDSGIDSLAALLARAKAAPDTLNWGVQSTLGFDHLAAERIMQQAGVKVPVISYQGEAPLRTDLLANRVQIAMGSPGVMSQFVNAGTLKPLAVTSASRWAEMPNVPTLAELGMKDLVIDVWFGAFAVAGVPAPIVDMLNREITAAIQTPEVSALLAKVGLIPMPMSPAQMTEFAAAAETSWGQVIKAMGVKPQ